MALQAFLWVNGRRKDGYSENDIQRSPPVFSKKVNLDEYTTFQ
jgi:hypothetical protein